MVGRESGRSDCAGRFFACRLRTVGTRQAIGRARGRPAHTSHARRAQPEWNGHPHQPRARLLAESAQQHLQAMISGPNSNTTSAAAVAATMVNNNAAAVLAAARAGRSEVIVSRDELVEIGGSLRMPDVVAAAGATQVEVGTTTVPMRGTTSARSAYARRS